MGIYNSHLGNNLSRWYSEATEVEITETIETREEGSKQEYLKKLFLFASCLVEEGSFLSPAESPPESI